jgi:hypothetical protein
VAMTTSPVTTLMATLLPGTFSNGRTRRFTFHVATAPVSPGAPHEVDLACRAFFRHREAGEEPGHPQSKGRWRFDLVRGVGMMTATV